MMIHDDSDVDDFCCFRFVMIHIARTYC